MTRGSETITWVVQKRMGENKADGIVDKNLKSFDVENLYVCGSSVFPEVDLQIQHLLSHS